MEIKGNGLDSNQMEMCEKYFQPTGIPTIDHSYLFKLSQSLRTSSNVRYVDLFCRVGSLLA